MNKYFLDLEYNKIKYTLGQGCYEINGKFYASVCGKLTIGKDNIVSVESTNKE